MATMPIRIQALPEAPPWSTALPEVLALPSVSPQVRRILHHAGPWLRVAVVLAPLACGLLASGGVAPLDGTWAQEIAGAS